MEAMQEEIASQVSSDDCTASVVKGKRTKRQRLQLPLPVAEAVSSTSSAEFSGSTTEEEEDMANCLILLAQGGASDSLSSKPEPNIIEETAADAALTNTPAGGKFTSRRFAEAATTTNAKAGFYVYECKTCNKCFPSFQALGGHRASHKKPKLAIPWASPAEETKAAVMDENSIQLSMNSFSVQVTAAAAASGGGNGKPRTHECSICGAEFTSGQALGGHMRRHRPPTLLETPREAKKEGSGLTLDLNLPAPSEEDHRSGGELPKSSSATATMPPAFSFASKTPLLRSTSALVDCHY